VTTSRRSSTADERKIQAGVEDRGLMPDDLPYETLDPGIREAVRRLRESGIETFESCEGGGGHAYPEPTVRFHGDRSEGFRALASVLGKYDLRVASLRRVWQVSDGEPAGPYWEIAFLPQHDPAST